MVRYFQYEKSLAADYVISPTWTFIKQHIGWEALFAFCSGAGGVIMNAQGLIDFGLLWSGVLGGLLGLLVLAVLVFLYYAVTAPYRKWSDAMRDSETALRDINERLSETQNQLRAFTTELDNPNLISLLDFSKIAEGKGWNFFDDESLHILDFSYAMRQAAYQGQIRIWGKAHSMHITMVRNAVLELVAPEFWKMGDIDPFGIARHIKEKHEDFFKWVWKVDNASTRARREQMRVYDDLHLEKVTALYWLEHNAEEYRGKHQREKEQDKVDFQQHLGGLPNEQG